MLQNDRSIVVYTAITDDDDDLKEPTRAAADGADFVAFLDKGKESKIWRCEAIHTGFADPCRNSKVHKILSHVYFPDALYSLWIDGSVSILFSQSVRQLIETYLVD